MTPARRRASGGHRASMVEVLGVVPPGAINKGGHLGATLGAGALAEGTKKDCRPRPAHHTL